MKKGEEILKVAALKYNAKTDSAPSIVALGQGELAKKIIDTARDNHIPVIEDKPLAQMLNRLQVGDEIPEELYQVVAQVLVFISTLDKEYVKRFGLKD